MALAPNVIASEILLGDFDCEIVKRGQSFYVIDLADHICSGKNRQTIANFINVLSICFQFPRDF